MLMSPNNDKTAVHGCSSYLHCSFSGEVVVRMRVGSGQIVELSAGGLYFLPLYMIFSFLHISVIMRDKILP